MREARYKNLVAKADKGMENVLWWLVNFFIPADLFLDRETLAADEKFKNLSRKNMFKWKYGAIALFFLIMAENGTSPQEL